MRIQFSSKSLFTQISVVMLSVLLVVTMVFSFWFTSRLTQNNKSIIIKESSAYAKSLSGSIATLLLSDKYTDIENLIKNSDDFSNIRKILVTNDKDVVVAEVGRTSAHDFTLLYSYRTISPPQKKSLIIEESESSITVWEPVELESIHNGWLMLEIDSTFLKEYFRDNVLTMLQVFFAVTGVSFIALFIFLRPKVMALQEASHFAVALAGSPGDKMPEDLGTTELSVLARALNSTSDALSLQKTEIESKHKALVERIKELNGIFSTSLVLNDPCLSLDEKMRKIVNLVPAAWQYPDISVARIIYRGTTFVSDNYQNGNYRLTKELSINGSKVGVVEIIYVQKKENLGLNPFSKEEDSLLGEIALNISNYLSQYEMLTELHYLNNNLEQRVKERTQELEKANNAKSEFLSRVSHELRTPMNAIMGFTTLLSLNKPDNLLEEQKDNLKYILESSEHLMQLINEILDIASIERGKLELRNEPMLIDDVVTSIMPMMDELSNKHGIVLRFLPQSTPKRVIKVDLFRIKQVLINLISNAIKYNRENGVVTISIENQSDGTQNICIKDTGMGMAPEQLEKIFEPFVRLPETNAKEGSGIGLAIVKLLTEHMGGTISVVSTPDKGSVFTLSFPALQLTD